MKILFCHPNMPGQYKHLAPAMAADPNNQVVFITKPKPDVNLPDITKVEYEVGREPPKETHRYLVNFERALFQGQEVWRVCNELKKQGFVPDVIVTHPGWGDTLFMKDIFHGTPMLSFLEFYYNPYASDVSFIEDEEENDADDHGRIRIKNACNLFNLEQCDWGITPTYFQLIQNPSIFFPKISVLHDGIDTDHVTPNDGNAKIKLPNGKVLTAEDEVVTHIARNFEPYRGFPQVMRAINEILQKRPNAQVVVVGADDVSYGKRLPNNQTYRQKMLEELKDTLDLSRLHFIGYLAYDDMLNVMRISSAHIYMTVPFVLSWSSMESMAAGVPLIASSTTPVLEIVEDGVNGQLVDFFDHKQLAETVIKTLEKKGSDEIEAMRKAARQTIIDKYNKKDLLPMHQQLIIDVAEKKAPPPVDAKMRAHNPIPDFAKPHFDEMLNITKPFHTTS